MAPARSRRGGTTTPRCCFRAWETRLTASCSARMPRLTGSSELRVISCGRQSLTRFRPARFKLSSSWKKRFSTNFAKKKQRWKPSIEKNIELEERMEQMSVEASIWQQRAKYNEGVIIALKLNLQQLYAQSRDSKEGCGDSEVDDTASYCNGRGIDFHLLGKENHEMEELMTCKVCRAKEVCMLLIPCKHLCLCKDCESKLSFCPLCQTSKFIGMEVHVT